MNNFLLLTAVVAVAATGSQAFPETMLNNLFRRRVSCSGDISEDIGACMAPLESISHPTTGLALDSVETKEQLNIVCGELATATRCVNQVHQNCGNGDFMSELMAETITNVVEYICDPAKADVLLDNTECWENKELEKEIESCGNDLQYGGDPCSALSSVRRCIKGHVEDECTQEAADFLDGLVFTSIESIANDVLGCNMRLRLSRSLWKLLPRSRK